MTTAPAQLRIWLVNLRREGYKPTKFSKICSAHFEDSFIDRTGQIVHLRAGAIPTKFDFPAYLLPKTGTKRKPSLKRTAPVSIASVGIPVPECGPSTGDQPLSTVIRDHPYDIQKSPCKLERAR